MVTLYKVVGKLRLKRTLSGTNSRDIARALAPNTKREIKDQIPWVHRANPWCWFENASTELGAGDNLVLK